MNYEKSTLSSSSFYIHIYVNNNNTKKNHIDGNPKDNGKTKYVLLTDIIIAIPQEDLLTSNDSNDYNNNNNSLNIEEKIIKIELKDCCYHSNQHYITIK